MDKDEAVERATLRGQRIAALEDARGIAHKMIVQDWAKHTDVPDRIDLKNEAFDCVMDAVTERITGGEMPEQLRAMVVGAFRDWENTRMGA